LNGQERGGENDRRDGIPERDARYFLAHLHKINFLIRR
jgi:hypothetical protein